MNRIEWLDYMKGIAIIAVVMGHVVQCLGKGYHPWAHMIVVFEMPLFFMLSGILAYKTTTRRLSVNLYKKAKSLLLPFIFFGGVYGLTFGTIQYVVFDMYHQGYWFLLSLFTCWVLFLPLSKLVTKFPHQKYAYIFELVILFLPFILYKVFSNQIFSDINESLTLNFTFTYYRFFIVGYFIGKIIPHTRGNRMFKDVMGGGIFCCSNVFYSHVLN